MSITRREQRVWSGGGANWGPYADGTIPPNWWNGPGYANTTGRAVNADTALRIAAVWACIQLVADYIAGLPVALVKPNATGEIETVGVPGLLARPWPEMTQYEWFFAMQASLMLRGNCYGRKLDFDSLGFPRMIQPVSADIVKVERDRGRLVHRFGTEIIPPDEVFHLRAFTIPGRDTGLSPIENFAQTLGIDLAAEDFGARFFGDGAHPTGVLESDAAIDKTQADTILDRIRKKFGFGSREPLILGAGTHWKQIQVNPNESQFLDTLKFGVNQIARIFGLGMCAELVGGSADGSAITYANVESRSIDLQTYGVMPWTVRWEQALTPLFAGQRTRIAFDLDARLKVDMKTRYEANNSAVRGGWKCADEVRKGEGLPPIPDDLGRQFLWPPFAVKFAATEDDPSIVGDPEAVPPAA